MSIRATIDGYLKDPLTARMWAATKAAGPVRSISVDITHICNLRCKGCYFFAEALDDVGEADDDTLAEFIQREKSRGINFVTVIGGEPSLRPDRLRKLAKAFRIMVVTNGLRSIPREGLEDITIAVSMWGDRATDRELRGYGKIDIFDRALKNFAGDDRARWYITLPAKPPAETVEVVDACVANGQLVAFNFYGDLQGLGDDLSHAGGFDPAYRFVDRMIDRHPQAICMSRYINEVVTSGRMLGESWGYDVCGSVSVDAPQNAGRLRNGKSYNPFFNAYGPDLGEPRRCCVGDSRDCSTCFDVWAHLSWIGMAMEKHLASHADFFSWLSTMTVFYGACGLIPAGEFSEMLPRIHARSKAHSGDRAGSAGLQQREYASLGI
ncbi:MAG: radical SAM protein [Candidatus Sphingomonas phytovorans]|nr:radical SAM protein [Sphingomonas sp.]WEJ99153.1 MAG: radical SAM protein [Sphingomonas sp.]